MEAMERFQVRKPIYPLLCLASSLAVLVGGLLMAKRESFWIFLLAMMVFYSLFGYIRPLLGAVAVFLPLSILFVLISLLLNQEWSVALTMGERVFLIGLCAVPSLGMPLIRLVRNLNQMHCPKMLTLGMLITVRFIPMVSAEVRQIREAMKTRGVRASLWNVRCFYRALLIPLVMRLISLSDTMSVSLETRGYELENTPVSIYERVTFTARDGVYLLAMAALLAASACLL